MPRGLIMVGVSGGADSMALLSVMAHLRHDLGVQLHAVHFNHRLRPEADSDERFVVKWCKLWNIPLTIGSRKGGALKHLSENDARQMRFKFFIQTARRLHAQSVALAHNQIDLAETVLMRVMRGSGLYGIRAILPRRSIEGVVFVRPLLDVSRHEVENYLKTKQIPFRTDASNLKAVYARNKVRLELLPLLAKGYNPRIVDALADLGATAGEDYDFLAACAAKQFEKKVTISGKKVKMNLKDIQSLHPAILRLIFRQMVEHLTGDAAAFDFEHIRALEDLAAVSGRLDLPQGLKAVRTSRFLEITHA